MSTITVTNIKATGETASRVVSGLAGAWVSFDMSTSTSIDASTNTTSITDNGTGHATVNFTSAFGNAFYTMAGSCIAQNFGSGYDGIVIRGTAQVTDPAPDMGAAFCAVQIGASGLRDYEYNSIAFHGDLS